MRHSVEWSVSDHQLPIISIMVNRNLCAMIRERTTNRLWHWCSGHLHQQAVDNLVHKNVFVSICKNSGCCDSCFIGKLSTSPHKSRYTEYKDPLSQVFADIWGPAPCVSSKGFCYYVNFVDA